MIFFKPILIPLILDNIKTVTRRVGHNRWNKGAIHQARTSYNTSPFALLRITSEPFIQHLRDMTPSDAYAEGGYTLHNCIAKTIDKIYVRAICNNCAHASTCFQKLWVSINDKWNPDEPVWVVNFELVKPKSHTESHFANVTEI